MDQLRRRYRLRKREESTEWEDRASEDISPGQCAEAAELSERLRNALAELPVKQAEAFCLFNLEGYSYQEIGVQLNCSIDNVGVLLHRARARLKQRLSEVGAE
jgi:RNA polymerase sigma-70 factor (ECF subfamily)